MVYREVFLQTTEKTLTKERVDVFSRKYGTGDESRMKGWITGSEGNKVKMSL